jgi:ABC-type multidrug transport system fused ATPase/permease subunit
VVGSVAHSIFNLVPDIAKVIVLIAGAYWVIRGDWTLGSLLAFQSYLGFVYEPALSLADTNLELQNALGALYRVSALMDVVPENTPGMGKQVEHLSGEIQFNHVSFSYNKAENVLEDISFHIKSGEHIAIVGPSGVGKTTLISLLLQFYRPIKGEVLFNHLNASEYNLDSLRRRIGYVSQVTLLMEGTIGTNLRYGNQNVSPEEMERAIRTAGIYDFITSLPDKYDSAVGEKGVNLSEGQKQRLSIARALIKDPDILIMDEPTSALDSLVEKSIFDELPEEVRGKTLLIAAHRLSTIQKADRVMVLKDSQLLGMGTHQELIKSNDYYRSLFS